MTTRHLVYLAVLLTCASPVWAQQSRHSAMDRAAEQAATVTVVADGHAEPIRGALRSIADSTVVVDVEGKLRSFSLDSVDRIDRDGDSVLNGTLIGAGILGGWCAYVCGQGSGRPFAYLAIVGGNAAIGGLFGALIDWGREGTTTIYRRPKRVQVIPAFAGRSVALIVKF